MNLEALIAAIEARQVELGAEALRTPNDMGLFQYGRHCGIYQGLDEAVALINKQLELEEERAVGKQPSGPKSAYFE